jgi:hypothetical protein
MTLILFFLLTSSLLIPKLSSGKNSLPNYINDDILQNFEKPNNRNFEILLFPQIPFPSSSTTTTVPATTIQITVIPPAPTPAYAIPARTAIPPATTTISWTIPTSATTTTLRTSS